METLTAKPARISDPRASLPRRMLGWLLFSSKKVATGGHHDLQPIDLPQLRLEVRLEEEAQRLGRADLPRADATVMTGVEELIVQKIHQAQVGYVRWGEERRTEFSKDIARYDVELDVNGALEHARMFERNSSSLLEKHHGTFKRLGDDLRGLTAEHRNFRTAHGLLGREAAFPPVSKKILLWLFLGLLIVAEGAANAWFFASGLESGLLGGFLYAFLFSFFNIGVATAFGRLAVPNVNHRALGRRLCGAISILAAAALTLLFALAIAHFRDALSLDLAGAEIVALQNLKAEPLGLQAVQSWLLFGVSIAFASLAVLDGYKMDDPYPGYGRLTRRLHQAQDDFDDEKEWVRQELAESKAEAMATLEQLVMQAETNLHNLQQAILHKEASGNRLRTALADAENCLAALIMEFRDRNQLARSTPPPPYFSLRPVLSDMPVPDFSVEEDLARYRAQGERVAEMKDRIESIKGEIQASFSRRHDALTPFDDQFNFAVAEGELRLQEAS